MTAIYYFDPFSFYLQEIMFPSHKYLILIIGTAIGLNLASPSYAASPTKAAECQAITDVFQGASANFQNTGNLSASVSLVDRLSAGLQGLKLQDPKLVNLQSRYIQYFNSSRQMMQTGNTANTAGDDTALRSLIALAQTNSSTGSHLSQELVEYCLQ